MPTMVEVPETLEAALAGDVSPSDLPRWALETMVVEAVRSGAISRGRGGEILGVSFAEGEEIYARHGLVYHYPMEALDAEAEVLRNLARP